MSHRLARVAHVIRDVVSDAIARRISDPRVHKFTSVTRVEVSPDLSIATVFVTVMGTPGEERTSLKGLQSASGMIRVHLARALAVRQVPSVRFVLDTGFKTALETFRLIDEALGRSAPPAGEATPAEPEDRPAANSETGAHS